jgi:hypothetical protein
MRAENSIEITGEDAQKMQKLLDAGRPGRRASPSTTTPSSRSEPAFGLAAHQDQQGLKEFNESIGSRRRWPRARPGLEIVQSPKAQRFLWHRAMAARPGPGCTTCPSPGWWNSPMGQANGIGLTVVGPEAAAGRGHRGRVPRPRAAHLWPHESGRAAGKLQGLFQSLHEAPRHSHGRLRDLHRPGAAHAYVDRRARPLWSRPTAWPRAKAWWWPPAGPGARGHRLHAAGQQPGRGAQRGWRARGDRRVPWKARKPASSSCATARTWQSLATSQDHKRLQDGDLGPNTGGMGAYSPAPVVTPKVHARAMREIILPTIRGMEKDGIPVHRLFVRRPDD